MNTITSKNSIGECFDWKLDDPKVQKGLSRLVKDLQAMMTKEDFHKLLRSNPPQIDCLPAAAVESFLFPALSRQVGEEGIPAHKAKSRRKSARHAA